jgi:glyoxylase-like metal-dependent hydrolase (beta-lactamase superfamily II)
MKAISLLALTIALIAPSAFAQQDFSKVEIKVVPVSKNIYMLEGSGGNIGVSVGDDGILIVDDQYAPLAEKIEAALQKLNPGKLKFVLNTHHHGDHTGGNAAFGAGDATIVRRAMSRCPSAARIQRKRHCPSSLSTTLPGSFQRRGTILTTAGPH